MTPSNIQLRPLVDESDYTVLEAIHLQSQTVDQVDPHSAREAVLTVDVLKRFYPFDSTVNSPNLQIAMRDGQVVGYVQVLWGWREITGVYVFLHQGYVSPQWRGQGIGRRLLQWAHERIYALAAEKNITGPKTFASNVSSTERACARLVEHAGYRIMHTLTDMAAAPIGVKPVRPLPAACQLAQPAPEHLHSIYMTWKAAYGTNALSTPPSESDERNFITEHFEHPCYDPSLCSLAVADGQVVGVVLAQIRRGAGMIDEVCVHPDWQRRGIAEALLQNSLNQLAARNMAQARLYTDAENAAGARTLYERTGFREVKQHYFYRKPLDEA